MGCTPSKQGSAAQELLSAKAISRGGRPPKPQAQAAKEQQAATAELRYKIVDLEDTAKTLEVSPGSEAEEYFTAATANRPCGLSTPWLVIAYGPPASGKTRTLSAFLSVRLQAKETDYVHLDPDELRYFYPEYRDCLCGTHAAKLESVRAEHGERIQPREWRSPNGRFVQQGMAVDGEFLALSTAAVRSNQLLRDKMLWGKPQKQPDGTKKWGGVGDNNCFVDRALMAGYNVVFNTIGDAPDGLLKELMFRARSQHPYTIYACGAYAPFEAVQERAQKRALESGRFVADGFLQMQYKNIFPEGEGGQLAHFNKFVDQMNEGDEVYLYDNSEDVNTQEGCGELKLIKHYPESTRAAPSPAAGDESHVQREHVKREHACGTA